MGEIKKNIKRKRERANNVEKYEEAQKVDRRDRGTEIMAKRTTGEPKDKLEKGKEKQKANSVTQYHVKTQLRNYKKTWTPTEIQSIL